jgi:hypothetical protein
MTLDELAVQTAKMSPEEADGSVRRVPPSEWRARRTHLRCASCGHRHAKQDIDRRNGKSRRPLTIGRMNSRDAWKGCSCGVDGCVGPLMEEDGS